MSPNMNSLPSYLVFAFANARAALERLIWSFNFEEQAGYHNYTGITPHYLLEVVNGFLQHWTDKAYLGLLRDLPEMKIRLEERLIPLYERGKDSAINIWLRAPLNKKAEFEELDNPALRDMARSLAPNGLMPGELSWFLEGFCSQWAQELLQYTVWTYAKDIEEEE
ncbi:MAG: hypothetical protein L0154_29420 [Chloroflexi bacterium]|nr:hypothetical protein [Chloroflexota bacterium]